MSKRFCLIPISCRISFGSVNQLNPYGLLLEYHRDSFFYSWVVFDAYDTISGKTENPVHSNQVANFFRNVDFHRIEEAAFSTLEGDRVRCASRQISTFH